MEISKTGKVKNALCYNAFVGWEIHRGGLFEKMEHTMQVHEQRGELPWAFATKPGYAGTAPGLYFRYFATREDAEKSLAWMKRKKRWHGPIEKRLGEAYSLGFIQF